MGAGVTPAEGSVKPTAGFTFNLSPTIDKKIVQKVGGRALRDWPDAGHNR